MGGWNNDDFMRRVRDIPYNEVKSYIDHGMTINRYNDYDPKTRKASKTFAICCGSYDGEHINLFDLQEWFDANRQWIENSILTFYFITTLRRTDIII